MEPADNLELDLWFKFSDKVNILDSRKIGRSVIEPISSLDSMLAGGPRKDG